MKEANRADEDMGVKESGDRKARIIVVIVRPS